jgi:hypothetical protein
MCYIGHGSVNNGAWVSDKDTKNTRTACDWFLEIYEKSNMCKTAGASAIRAPSSEHLD